MVDVWKDRPIWLEFFGHAKNMLKDGWDVPYAVEWMLTNHVSVVNSIPFLPGEVKDNAEVMALTRKLDLYAGARLVPKRAEVRRTGADIVVRLAGYNKGVARIHLPYCVQVVVMDAEGKEVFAHEASADVGKWMPGKFGFVDKFMLPAELASKELQFAVRLRHRPGALRNFRFAVKESAPDGTLPLCTLAP